MVLVLFDYYLEYLLIYFIVFVLDSFSRFFVVFVCFMYVFISIGFFFLGFFGEDFIIWFLRVEFGGFLRFFLIVYE